MKAVDGRQLRAGRALLGWSIQDAAAAAKIHRNSVAYAEGLETLPIHAWGADKLSKALEDAGVKFGVNETGPSVSIAGSRMRLPSRMLKQMAGIK